MYQWLVYLHVIGVFGLLLAHGGSASVAFRLRGERNAERVRALLDLSSSSLSIMYGSIVLLLVTGIIAGFVGNWWGRGWIWAALGLLVAILVVMFFLGTGYYNRVRQAVGLPYFDGKKTQPAGEPVSNEELIRVLDAGNPVPLAALGGGALIMLLWLMMFKPF
jgi:hypothetical protein